MDRQYSGVVQEEAQAIIVVDYIPSKMACVGVLFAYLFDPHS